MLLLLSVIVMLGVGNGYLYTDYIVVGGCSEFLDRDLDGEQDRPISLIHREGDLDIRPNLVLTSSISSSDGEAVLSWVLCTS